MDKADQIAEARRKLLEKRLKAKRRGSGTSDAPSTFPKFPDGEPIPATYGQQSLWYVQQIAPDSAVYNMANVMRIEGHLRVDWLQHSLDLIVARHEILRTNFVLIDGDLQQQIRPAAPVTIHKIAVDPAQTHAMIYQQMEVPFDLADDPLVRVALLQESETAHVMVISMHHIISDKWSLEVLIWRELAACYTALSQGRDPDLPPVETQFKDFTGWQAQKSETQVYQEKLAYWQAELDDAPALLQLPTDKPRPPQQQFEGEVLYDTLPAIITEQLQAVSKANGATLFMTLMAAYMVLLHRMSREDDILVGTSVDLRTHASLEQTIGYFLNTVVLRQQFDEPLTFSDLLQAVKQCLLKAFTHQDVEFENLVQHLRPDRDPSYNPLFQTMFVMWDANHTEPTLPDLELTTIKLDPNIAKFDLTLYAQVNPDNTLLLALEYATSLFLPETMARLMQVYQTLLQSIVKTPDAPIDRLDWLPAAQRHTLLNEWAQPEHQVSTERLIHQLIAEHDPDAIAMRYAEQTLTYGALNHQAQRLAQHLIAQGITPNTPVGIMIERSPEMLIGILGILQAGGAYVPIDPAYPEERIQFLLEDSGVTVLLTDSHIVQTVPAQITRINLDEPYEAPNDTPLLSVDVNGDDLAYMIYTSGSTGTPKGVRVSHRNLIHSTTARFAVYPQPIERFLLLSSFAFDSSLVGIFWTLAGGGQLILPPQGAERDVAQIARLIDTHQITHLLALPSLYSILLDFGITHDLSSLKTVIVAGEACPLTLVEAHYAHLPSATLYNEYGPTEGTVWATVSEIRPDTERIHIGQAIPNMQTYILDEQHHPVPIGMAGELVIGGMGITQGYHERPELTAERFIKNPFGEGRLYRTGDLARYLPDGNIDFMGRIDRQVKISGYRIEIGEIENAVSAMASVTEAVVIAHDLAGSKQLVGFIVQDESSSVDAVRQALQAQLPHYMIPTRFIALDDLPRTPNGKIDHQQLRALVTDAPQIAASTERIVTDEIEQQLIDIWEELLGVPVPDTDADFFALGGYSLLAIRMFAKVNQTFDKDLPVSTIFEAPTIAQLAEIVRSDRVRDSAVITFQDGTGGLPIYCLQVNRFGVLHYQTFVERLSDEHPVYGLVIPPAMQDEQITIEASATVFVEAIKAQAHDQQILLLGLSLAGVVGYEVARQLREQGIESTVIMIDTQGPNFPITQSPLQALQEKTRLILREYSEAPLDEWGHITSELAWIVRYRAQFQLHKRSNWVLAKLGLPLIYDKEQHDLRAGGDGVREQVNAYYQRQLQSDDVQILLYRGRLQPITSQYAWALGWDTLVPDDNITVHTVVGPHADLLKAPYIEGVMRHLQPWLDAQSS